MKRIVILVAVVSLALVVGAPGARAAAFGVEEFSLGFAESGGSPATQAGSHPSTVTNLLRFDAHEDPLQGELPNGLLRDVGVKLPPGLVGRPAATPRCADENFIEIEIETKLPNCPEASAVGTIIVKTHFEALSVPRYYSAPVYNLAAPKGVIEELGFVVTGVPVTMDFKLSEEQPYDVVVELNDVNQTLPIISSRLTLWGDPASPTHDLERGHCIKSLANAESEELLTTGESCPSGGSEEGFIRLPTSCGEIPSASYLIASWEGESAAGDSPVAQVTGCSSLGFEPTTTSTPTTQAASTSSGLEFSLDAEDPGLTSVDENSQSDIRRAEVSLPEGFTINPSVAQGLEACSVADLARESAESEAGAGCPQASKIGSVEVETPLLEESLQGALYVAKPFENEFDSLLATYMVIKDPQLGILIRQGIKIVPDEATGRLAAIAEGIPQLPFSHFRLHFRGGERAPLTTPSGCGSYDVDALVSPWSGGPSVTDTNAFQITTGAGGGSCPSSLPFAPGFEAGTTSTRAGSASPFVLDLSRGANQAAFGSIDTVLPEGLLAKLAGITECSDAQIAVAAGHGGASQGVLEAASPSCPSNSEVGVVYVGAGSGSPTYVKGHVYLAGPYKGAPLSLAIITPAVTGPFDLGTVVVRVALQINERTAQVEAVSDPLPTILHGIPLQIRSVALELNRPDFTRNPTSCEPKTITGSVNSVLGSSLPLAEPFQASECGRLTFKPKVQISLKGPTKRAGLPALKATVTYPKKGGYANIARAQVSLPHAEFLEQSNIGTACTRPLLAARACPKKSIYGKAKAWTPLLAKPLTGNVYLVGGFGYKLPALVAELNGQIRVVLVGKIDTDKQHGIRTTFEGVPDAPIEKFVLEMKGGKKYGLLVNSENLCGKPQLAAASFKAQTGKQSYLHPQIANDCGNRPGRKAKGK